MLLLMFGLLVRVSREMDASIAHALEATRLRSAAEAEDRVRDRMRTLVHDELLYLLTSGARDAPALRASVAAEEGRIRRAITDLHERPEPGAPPEVATREVVDRLTAVAAHELPGAACAVEATAGGIPAHVADAVEGALRQALVNTRMHAGEAATASIVLGVHRDRVHVTVRDDGAGFAAEAVPVERMGIATSIVGRLSAIPGGSARVTSRPGAGTTVTIDWRQVEVAPASPEDRAGILAGEGAGTRRGLLVAGAFFLLAQAVLAAFAAARTGDPGVPFLAFAGVAVALLGMGWRGLERPSRRRVGLVLAAAGATALVSLAPATRDPLAYGDLWYVPALGFVLLALAARGRPGLALLGGGAVVAIALVGLAIPQDDAHDVVAATTRLIGVLGIGVCLVVATERIRRRVTAVRAAELEAVRTSTFERASRKALRERSRELEALVTPVLAALERGDPLSPDERRECAALEGRLRDQYRAGRLGRPALVRSAMAARRRGVDVALLDDGSGRPLAEAELERVATWMAGLLDAVTTGPATGRILPAGRAAVASLVAGDDVALLAADDAAD